MNPRKMQQMMKQKGIDVDEIDADSVVITTSDGEELVFDAPQVTRMDAQGTRTFQIVGEPETRAAGSTSDEPAGGETAEADTQGIPEEDVAIVASRAEVPKGKAREALEAENGDLAAAIARLE